MNVPLIMPSRSAGLYIHTGNRFLYSEAIDMKWTAKLDMRKGVIDISANLFTKIRCCWMPHKVTTPNQATNLIKQNDWHNMARDGEMNQGYRHRKRIFVCVTTVSKQTLPNYSV